MTAAIQRVRIRVDGVVQALRAGGRLLVKDRAFTIAAVTALALGMAVATTVFTVLYGMNLRALPFEPQTLKA